MSSGRLKWLLFFFAVLVLLISGRQYRLHVRQKWLKPVTVDKSDGLVHITLPVISKACDTHGGCVVETDGLYRGQPTGLTVIFAPGMRPSTFTDRVATTQVFAAKSGVTLVAEGPRGKSLVHLLAENYSASAHHLNLPVTVVTTAVPLAGNPANIQTQPLKFKIIGAGKESPDSFELYVNVDLAKNQVQLREKDTAFRTAILNALGVN